MPRARRRRRALARGKDRLGGRSRGSRYAARVAWYGSGGQSPALQSHRFRQRAPRGFRVLYLIPIICSRQAEETVHELLRHPPRKSRARRSEEHTSELQSLIRISYAVFCLKKKKPTIHISE